MIKGTYSKSLNRDLQPKNERVRKLLADSIRHWLRMRKHCRKMGQGDYLCEWAIQDISWLAYEIDEIFQKELEEKECLE